MGAGAASKCKGASADDYKVAAKEVTDEEKKLILDALLSPDESKTNSLKVKGNNAKMHMLETVVKNNKQKIYEERAFIEETRQLILANYSAAFMGNRQMAAQNTEDIFRIRKTYVKSLKVDDDVKKNFLNSKLNEDMLEYLQHSEKIQQKASAVNKKMQAINELLMEVNEDIMATNAEIVSFNTDNLRIGSWTFENATPEGNGERIDKNTKTLDDMLKLAGQSTAENEASLEKAKECRDRIAKNNAQIFERRVEIQKNHQNILQNAEQIGRLMADGDPCPKEPVSEENGKDDGAKPMEKPSTKEVE